MPTYNREKTIKKAIESVLDQTYENFELIVIDDASCDNTKKVIENYTDNRIKYIYCKRNSGANVARNIGMTNADGEYLAFLDSDNRWIPEKLQKQMELFESEPDVAMIFSAFNYIENGKVSLKPRSLIPFEEFDDLKRVLQINNVVDTSTMIIKKECIEDVGVFDEEMPRLQDYEFAIRISERYKTKFIPEPLVDVYRSEVSISTNFDALEKANILIIKKHKKFFEEGEDSIEKRLLTGFDAFAKYGAAIDEYRKYFDLLEKEMEDEYPEKVMRVLMTAIERLVKKIDKMKKSNDNRN